MQNLFNVTTIPGHAPAYDGPLDFAFVVHPRDMEDIFRAYPDRRGRPDAEVQDWANGHPVHVLSFIEVETPDALLRGELLAIPTLATAFRGHLDQVRQHLVQVLHYCSLRGVRMVGLGALLPGATTYGRWLLPHARGVGVTTGHAYTAFAVAEHVRRVESLSGPRPTVAIVGAAGSTGYATAQCLLSDGRERELLLVDLPAKSGALQRLASAPGTACSFDLEDLARARVVVCLTNEPRSILRSRHLAEHAVIIDDAQPENVDRATLQGRPDLAVVKCLAAIPGLRCPFDFGLFGADRERKQHISFTCLAETILLAWAGHDQHFTVARPTMDQVEVIRGLAAELGVSIAPFHSFPEIGEVRIPAGPPGREGS